MTSFGDDDIGESFRRFDELNMHGPHRRDVLLDYRIQSATALGNIAPQAANETHVVRSIDEHLNVHLLEQPRLGKNQDTFDNHDGLRRYRGGGRQSRVRAKVVIGSSTGSP